ncbi:hypothetical protein [Asticcacaulis sp. AND118]|uniref:hypothetical protein n=1 Tax=Asticcacaulis sp. AND118 TaxID=2840468 RepID=UPI001CFF7C7B|nr:hypothetical protein [Asticcacaulis sp. AND118]UDF02465.1 hypothetical protein LH365_08420 [Asticcacaulis sp. AND118]
MSPELRRSLDLIRATLPPDEPWWIIGSAALYLSGIPVDARDVDVYGSSDVIEAAGQALGMPVSPPRTDAKFRSSPYFQYRPEGGLEIDFMGGLEVFSDGDWHELQIESNIWIEAVRVPTLREQAATLRLFGRSKDIERLTLIGDL